MADTKVAFAIGAHPDDVEFTMAGTLAALKDAGYECHIMTLANGSCGTAEYGEAEIIEIRRHEAAAAAAAMGATYHPGLVEDLMIYYDDKLLRRLTAVVREVRPEIVLCHSPNDYMEDHMITCRLTVTACFCRGMMNYFTSPHRPPVDSDVFLYHAQPHGNRDPLRRRVVPGLFVDIGDQIELKEEMLRAHASQKHWLDVSQGMDSYLHTMRELCGEVAAMDPRPEVKYAEGFRQHLHLGFSARHEDRLAAVLGARVRVNEEYERELG